MRQKGFAHLILLLVIGGVLIGWYWFWRNSYDPYGIEKPTPLATETPAEYQPSNSNSTKTGWKVYTNTKLGFSIEYPEEWKVTSFNIPDTRKFVCFHRYDNEDEDFPSFCVNLTSSEVLYEKTYDTEFKGKTNEDYFSYLQARKTGASWQSKPLDAYTIQYTLLRQFTFLDSPAVELLHNGGLEPSYAKEILVNNPDVGFFNLSLQELNKERFSEYEDIYTYMVSSFKLIN